MNDDERDLAGLSHAEDELAHRLARLGPLMREQEQSEAEMEQVFARNLRAYLIYGEERTPHPGFARTLRQRLLRGPAEQESSRRRRLVEIGGTAVASAALLLAILWRVLQSGNTSTFNPPYPTRADLLFSYPAPAVVIHRLTPIPSLVHGRPGLPFAGHLRLVAPVLPREPAQLPAYQLAPVSHVARLRALLHIRSPIRRIVSGGETWAVAADGGFPSHQPLHSLAVSTRTGELIYHDRRNRMLPHAKHALDRRDAINAARTWLAQLGWPGARMPLRSFGNVLTLPKVREIVLGWIGPRAAATEEATLWVTPDGSVVEAWAWPPIVRSGLVPARSVSSAWHDLQKGALPLAVEGVPPQSRANGTGAIQRVSVVSILTPGTDRRVYLVPTYRFQGRARLQGTVGKHAWYSLAPSQQKSS